MDELRIMCGTQRGAVLALDDRPYLIGAHDKADVVLDDPCIAMHHATLWPSGDKWSIKKAEGYVFNASGKAVQSAIELVKGDFVRFGDVWLAIAEQGAPWESPPSAPARARSLKPRQGKPSSAPGLSLTFADWLDRSKAGLCQVSRLLIGRRGLAVSAAMVVAGVMVAGYAASMQSRPREQQRSVAAAAAPASSGAAAQPTAVDHAPDQNAAPAMTLVPTPKLEEAFRQRLEDAKMSSRFDLKLQDRSWNMDAMLDDRELADFEKLLGKFVSDYRVAFPVDVKVKRAAELLPFRIQTVAAGRNSFVVTQDGERLTVGDEYRGVRVVAITGRSVTFAGKRSITVFL